MDLARSPYSNFFPALLSLALSPSSSPSLSLSVSTMRERKGKLMVDTPIFVYGTLKVGAVVENGFLSGVYQLDGESMKL